MLLDFRSTALTSQSFVFVLPQKFFDDSFTHRRRCWVIGKRHVVAKDVAESSVSICSFERSVSIEHLVNENTDSPPSDS